MKTSSSHLQKYQPNNDNDNNEISGLEGVCSRTFIKSSYKISGLLITNPKQMSSKAKNTPKNIKSSK